MNQPETLDLDDIEARAGGLYEYATGLDTAWQEEADRLAGTDVPALVAEVRRLRARVTELDRPEAAIRHVEQVFAAELADHRALTLLDALIVLRSKLPCTCARAAGLHETGCRRYVPGHELLSPALRLARGREGLAAAAAVVPAVPATTKDGAQ